MRNLDLNDDKPFWQRLDKLPGNTKRLGCLGAIVVVLGLGSCYAYDRLGTPGLFGGGPSGLGLIDQPQLVMSPVPAAAASATSASLTLKAEPRDTRLEPSPPTDRKVPIAEDQPPQVTLGNPHSESPSAAPTEVRPATPTSMPTTRPAPPAATPTTALLPTITPSPAPRPTSPPAYTRATRPPIIVGLTGQYTIRRDGNLWSINASFKPTRQENVNLKINDLEMTLVDQNPPLPNNPKEAVANINGLGASHPDNWKCEVVKSDNGNRIACKGTATLALNAESTLVVSFEQQIQQVNPLYLHFSSDGTLVGAMNPIAR